MRVLLLHNRYQQAGGEDVVVEAEKTLLESHGHAVSLLEEHNDAISGLSGKLRAAASVLYSPASKEKVKAEIGRFRPDVAHVHNFFPLLSPSVYDACREAGIPVVQTLHNYRLTCANAFLYREGRICEDCLGKDFPWPAVLHHCYRGSHLQSLATASMLGFHRWRGTWANRVDAYIALTAFQRQLLIRSGLPPENVHVKPNFIMDPGHRPLPEPKGDYLLFVGRLSEEKGLGVILEAYRRHGLRFPLRIVGDGPQRAEWEERSRGLPITFLGKQEKTVVLTLLREARFLLFPSIWYEGFPMTIVEAFAVGLPVMASDLGGMPEILADGERGWLVKPGDPASWAVSASRAWSDTNGTRGRAQAARYAYEHHYAPEQNYLQLRDIYQRLCTPRRLPADALNSVLSHAFSRGE